MVSCVVCTDHSAVCRPVQCAVCLPVQCAALCSVTNQAISFIIISSVLPPRDFADQDSLQTFHITSSTSSSSPISRHASVSSTYHGQSVRPSVIRKSVSPYCPSYFRISILSASLRPHKALRRHCGGQHGG